MCVGEKCGPEWGEKRGWPRVMVGKQKAESAFASSPTTCEDDRQSRLDNPENGRGQSQRLFPPPTREVTNDPEREWRPIRSGDDEADTRQLLLLGRDAAPHELMSLGARRSGLGEETYRREADAIWGLV